METGQDPAWAQAHQVLGLEKKRIVQYSLDQQLTPTATAQAATGKSTYNILLGLVVVLLIALLVITAQILSTLRQLSGKAEKEDYNKLNANLLFGFVFVFFAAIAYEIAIHKKYILPESASAHGIEIDFIMWTTTALTGFVFIVTQFLLFYFSYRYQHSPGRKASYYTQNNLLEVVWTTIPAAALTIMILYGFKIWVNVTMTNATRADSHDIELYAFQFGWKFRYPGPDGKFGRTDYRFTDLTLPNGKPNPVGLDASDPAGADDIIKDELIMPKGKMVKLHMRSRDVLHAAWLPHFRAQMYCVPGTPTQFSLEPLYTTEEYREKINKPDFNFELACNQICGVSHYAMRREIIVVDESEYLAMLGNETPAMAGMEFPASGKLTLNKMIQATK